MKKIAVVFWSGTGNTEAMAQAVGEGVKKGGAEASVMSVDQASKDILAAHFIISRSFGRVRFYYSESEIHFQHIVKENFFSVPVPDLRTRNRVLYWENKN